jgi:hypothetical protein
MIKIPVPRTALPRLLSAAKALGSRAALDVVAYIYGYDSWKTMSSDSTWARLPEPVSSRTCIVIEIVDLKHVPDVQLRIAHAA